MFEILNVESGIEMYLLFFFRFIIGLFLYVFLVFLRKRRNYLCFKYIVKYNLFIFFKNLEIVWGKFFKSFRFFFGKV